MNPKIFVVRELDQKSGFYLYRKGGFHNKESALAFIHEQETPQHDFDIVGW